MESRMKKTQEKWEEITHKKSSVDGCSIHVCKSKHLDNYLFIRWAFVAQIFVRSKCAANELRHIFWELGNFCDWNRKVREGVANLNLAKSTLLRKMK